MQKSEDKYFNLDPITLISQEVKMAKAFYITGGGKLWVPETNKFFKKLEGLQKFCLEDMRTIWLSFLKHERELFLCCETEEEYSNFEHHCLILMQVSEVIEKMEAGLTAEEIKKLVDEQGHSGSTFAELAGLLLAFYQKGIEFFEAAVPSETERGFYKSNESWYKSLQRICVDRYQKASK